ncbi:3-deoxy-7-phosphoheptulonate synthase [uncultured Desulfuromonas sp.]|uniref:3-deoxy-7-phosphoheptulonate synthase n=1 Tax=uncultured Desulfuromonas sp. TaxID=181013 RepID=UPI002AAAD98B|nr:3-deoxy-7-phosphoheptulonate synthase [uncultured Desulfuromonas sp.]
MYRTNNLNIKGITEVIAPSELRQVFPLSEQSAAFVTRARNEIQDILHNQDQRLMIVVGPCSIHDPEAALDYARRLSKLSHELDDQLHIVMRVYFEKPRTTVGWKGLINDPDLDGSHLISKGLGIARQLFCAITELELPIATEMLDTITPEYFADLISWGAIGARTTESQPHREMSSGLSFPVGFKNSTDGNLQIAMDAMSAARHGHSFLGINRQGKISIVETCGNPDAHIVLRGGSNGPNYQPEAIAFTEKKLADQNLNTAIMVDCSHANSCKDHNRQEEVIVNVLDQIANGNNTIRALMIESNIEEGNQPIGPQEELKYGVSITDKCIGWETTDRLLRMIHSSLKKNNGRSL